MGRLYHAWYLSFFTFTMWYLWQISGVTILITKPCHPLWQELFTLSSAIDKLKKFTSFTRFASFTRFTKFAMACQEHNSFVLVGVSQTLHVPEILFKQECLLQIHHHYRVFVEVEGPNRKVQLWFNQGMIASKESEIHNCEAQCSTMDCTLWATMAQCTLL